MDISKTHMGGSFHNSALVEAIDNRHAYETMNLYHSLCE